MGFTKKESWGPENDIRMLHENATKIVSCIVHIYRKPRTHVAIGFTKMESERIVLFVVDW